MKGWRERIAAPAATGDAAAGLARGRVVERDHPGAVAAREGLLLHGAEELRDGQALEHAVIGGPVVVLPSGGGQGTGHGVPAEIEQPGEKLRAHALMIRGGGEEPGRVREEPLEVGAQ